jgi:hypothetical protein
MVAVTVNWFTKAPANIVGGETAGESSTLDWYTDTVKVALLNALPVQDTAEFWSDLSATEVTGTNWAAGGQSLASKAIIVTAGTNTVALDAADVSVATVTVAGVTHIAVYKDSGVAATSPLLGYGTLGATSGSSGGTLNIAWAAAGILTFTAG